MSFTAAMEIALGTQVLKDSTGAIHSARSLDSHAISILFRATERSECGRHSQLASVGQALRVDRHRAAEELNTFPPS